MNISKYAFNSKEQFQTKYKTLFTKNEEGNLIPEFKFAVVEIGYLVQEQATQDEEGNELTPAIYSETYHVDVAWFLKDEFNEEGELLEKDHPNGWRDYSQDIDTEGVHGFSGVSYLDNKFKK